MNVLKQNMKWDFWTKIKQFFCVHSLHIHNIEDLDVICWHWTHGKSPNNDYLFIQIQLRCKNCGAYYLTEIRNRKLCDKFAREFKDKMWSDTCQPEWKYISVV